MSPSTNNHADRGYIIPIGGAEEKFHNPEILDRFIDICGGKDARIGIIPTASELEDTGRNYEKLFRKLGCKHARVLHFVTRDASEDSLRRRIHSARWHACRSSSTKPKTACGSKT